MELCFQKDEVNMTNHSNIVRLEEQIIFTYKFLNPNENKHELHVYQLYGGLYKAEMSPVLNSSVCEALGTSKYEALAALLGVLLTKKEQVEQTLQEQETKVLNLLHIFHQTKLSDQNVDDLRLLFVYRTEEFKTWVQTICNLDNEVTELKLHRTQLCLKAAEDPTVQENLDAIEDVTKKIRKCESAKTLVSSPNSLCGHSAKEFLFDLQFTRIIKP